MSAVAAVLRRDQRPISDVDVEGIASRISYRGTFDPHVWRSRHVALIEATHRVRKSDREVERIDGDPAVHIVADANLASRKSLVRELRARQRAVDLSTSDRELIRQAYLEWRTDCVHWLAGEFAFVIWDGHTDALFAAHDQMAARELFYSTDATLLVVSNELLGVRQHPDVTDALNEDAVGEFLLFGTPHRAADSSTIFLDIKRLLPGHLLSATEQRVDITRYWDFPLTEPMLKYKAPADYVAHFRQLLSDAVSDRLEDVPKAVAHLSGGLDSTSVTAIAAELGAIGRVSTSLTAISVVYYRISPDTEAFYSNLAAEKAGVSIEFLPADDFVLRRPLSIRAERLQDFAVGLSRRLQDTTASAAPLILSGKGGDELLTQTPLYAVMLQHSPFQADQLYRWLWHLTGRRPSLGGYRAYLGQLLRRSSRRDTTPGYPATTWLDPDFARRTHLEQRWHDAWRDASRPRHRTQPDVVRYMGNAVWNIRAEFLAPPSYAPSDATFPFADLRLIKFVMSLPPAPWNTRKQLLRDAMATALPREVLQRQKQPAPPFELSLVNRPDARWIDEWTPTQTLRGFVECDRVPPVHGADTIGRAVIDSRPLFLNEWLRAHGFE